MPYTVIVPTIALYHSGVGAVVSLVQWFSTWGPRTPKWSANDFKGAARSKGSARGPPKC